MRNALAVIVLGGVIVGALSVRDSRQAVRDPSDRRSKSEGSMRAGTAAIITSALLTSNASTSTSFKPAVAPVAEEVRVHRLPSRRGSSGKEKLCRVHGSVRDRRNNPCPRATVEVVNEFLAGLADRADLAFEADEHGEFVVLLPLLDPHVIRAQAPGLITLRPVSFGFRPCSRTRIFDIDVVDDRNIEAIVLAAPSELRGTLLDERGSPIPNGYVKVHGSVYCQEFFATPDARGSFVVHGAPEDLYTVYGHAEGYTGSFSGERVAVLEGAGGDVAVVMSRTSTATLRGRVVVSEPIPGAKAYVAEQGHWRRWVDIEGNAFAFENWDPGVAGHILGPPVGQKHGPP